MKLTIQDVEAAVNKCARIEAQEDRSLTPTASALAEVYGQMIFERASEIDFADYLDKGIFGESHLEAIKKYCVPETNGCVL